MDTKLRAVMPDRDLLHLYEQMVLSREFEESCAEQYKKGHITGFLHLYSGQEAVAVGSTHALHRDDYILSAYREHAQAIVRGAEPRRVMAELFGKSTGICKGKGGSMHLFDPALSFMGGDMPSSEFTVSNLGMFGVDEFTAVIQPPQGAILAVGAIRDEAVVQNGGLAAARIMRVTLSADHRLIDGAYAARFLQELKRVLENPVTILL